MASADYSKAILAGLMRSGMNSRIVATILQVPIGELSLYIAGKPLSDSQLQRIETATGVTAGRLAFNGDQMKSEKLDQVLEAWSELLDNEEAAEKLSRYGK